MTSETGEIAKWLVPGWLPNFWYRTTGRFLLRVSLSWLFPNHPFVASLFSIVTQNQFPLTGVWLVSWLWGVRLSIGPDFWPPLARPVCRQGERRWAIGGSDFIKANSCAWYSKFSINLVEDKSMFLRKAWGFAHRTNLHANPCSRFWKAWRSIFGLKFPLVENWLPQQRTVYSCSAGAWGRRCGGIEQNVVWCPGKLRKHGWSWQYGLWNWGLGDANWSHKTPESPGRISRLGEKTHRIRNERIPRLHVCQGSETLRRMPDATRWSPSPEEQCAPPSPSNFPP